MLAEVALEDSDDRRLCCFPSQNQRLNQFEFVAITGDLSQVPKEVGELAKSDQPLPNFSFFYSSVPCVSGELLLCQFIMECLFRLPHELLIALWINEGI